MYITSDRSSDETLNFVRLVFSLFFFFLFASSFFRRFRSLFAFVFASRQVRLGVIRQLADFFREMNPQQREKHLNVLVEVRDVTAVNC